MARNNYSYAKRLRELEKQKKKEEKRKRKVDLHSSEEEHAAIPTQPNSADETPLSKE